MTEAQALELETTYVVANTPAYLYRKLRESDVVRQLAGEFNAEQLTALYHNLVAVPNRTVSHVAQAYAMMVAMTLRDYAEWRPLIDGLDVSRLDWAERIRAIATQRATPTLATSLTVSPVRITGRIPATSTNTEERVAVQPRVVITDSTT